MKYKLTMKRSYNEIEFIFDNFSEGCRFIKAALDNSQEEISIIVEAITEEEVEEVNEEEEESTDEE